MENNDSERNAQTFAKRLVSILGEKHEKVKEAKFIMIAFAVIVVIIIAIITN